jgi:hypothetical protein
MTSDYGPQVASLEQQWKDARLLEVYLCPLIKHDDWRSRWDEIIEATEGQVPDSAARLVDACNRIAPRTFGPNEEELVSRVVPQLERANGRSHPYLLGLANETWDAALRSKWGGAILNFGFWEDRSGGPARTRQWYPEANVCRKLEPRRIAVRKFLDALRTFATEMWQRAVFFVVLFPKAKPGVDAGPSPER